MRPKLQHRFQLHSQPQFHIRILRKHYLYSESWMNRQPQSEPQNVVVIADTSENLITRFTLHKIVPHSALSPDRAFSCNYFPSTDNPGVSG